MNHLGLPTLNQRVLNSSLFVLCISCPFCANVFHISISKLELDDCINRGADHCCEDNWDGHQVIQILKVSGIQYQIRLFN